MSARGNQSQTAKPKGSLLRAPEPKAAGRLPTTTGNALIPGLQEGLGNRATTGLLAGLGLVQASLRIGPTNDAYEREADRVANRVMAADAAPASSSLQRVCSDCEEELQREPLPAVGTISEVRIQRMCSECEEELDEEEPLQRDASGASRVAANSALESRVSSLQGRGAHLSPAQRGFFEPRFGHDFNSVRLHTGAAASDAARLVRARAFTVGRDIAFGAGEYRPETRSGRRLLAHELTHVVQQTPLVARRTPLVQRQAETEEAAPTPEPERPGPETTPQGPEPESGEVAESQAPVPGLLVDDEATDLAPGQMTKSAFMAETRAAACRSADAAFAGTDNTTQSCPYIELALRFYERRSAERIEQDLLSYTPEAARANSARDYIPLIAERVRQSAETYVETGEITGIPGGLPSGLGLLAGAASLFGGLFFKAREGGSRGNPDPSTVQAQLGAGRPMDSAVRSRMGSALGRSFSDVRVHTGSTATRLTNRFNARAFAVGNHVAFGSGEYKPGTPMGDALLAHELAHTVQQSRADATIAPLLPGTTRTTHLERDADRAAGGVAAALWGSVAAKANDMGRKAIPRLRSGLTIQRCTSKPSAGMSISVRTPPKTTGDCGGVFSEVRWRVPSTSRDGTIVQHVHVDYSLLETCAGAEIQPLHHPYDPLEYYEAWEVKNARIYAGWAEDRAIDQGIDKFEGLVDYGSLKSVGGTSGGNVGSKGDGKATGKVAFLPGYTRLTEGGWGPHKFGGTLPTRQTPPTGWSKAIKLDHWLSTEWECCPSGDKSQWKKTKVDGEPK